MLTLLNNKILVAASNGRWRGVFFPCAASGSSLKPCPEAAKYLVADNAIWVSSAFSSFALFRNVMQNGEWFGAAKKTTRRGAPGGDPNINDNLRPDSNAHRKSPAEFALEFFEGKLRSNNLQPNLNERTRIAPTP
jgi:hypothetical protein